jgi:hypothetical protein
MVDALRGSSVSELRRVARAAGIKLPADLKTADEIQEFIARNLSSYGMSDPRGGRGSRAVRAAAGHDITPGHDELHHFWTRGKGLARWVGSPTPWTTLVALLSEHVPLSKARVFASRWYIEVFGYAAGSDKARVAHGKPPRGDRIGPG